MDNVHLPKHQKVGEVAAAPEKISYIKDESFSYPSDAKVTESDSFINAAHFKATPNRLEQMARRDAVQKNNEANSEKRLERRRSATSKVQGPPARASENGALIREQVKRTPGASYHSKAAKRPTQ